MHRMCGPSHGTWAARKLTPGADDAGGALSCPRPLEGERMFAEVITQNVDESKLIDARGQHAAGGECKIRSRPGGGQLSDGAHDAPVEAVGGAGARTAAADR
jgi:hypothetical protein